MAGMFELFVDPESAFRFRLTAPDGTIMAVSKPFDTKMDAVAGIAAVREYAGMGLIADQCTTSTNAAAPAACDDSAGQPADAQRVPKIDFHTRARAVRRAVSGPRWAGAIHNLS
ncbi:YegP family protein [Paenarthrobacter sp. RAF54_2]|uniref:YegP family protein n=1 Tax=Paenarthrobacter sp. RAF54_2 TaxID=3233061 RepID=UPI003F9B50BA